jgi:hypothetical protein
MSGEWGHSSEKYDVFFLEDLIPQLKPTFDFSQADENSKDRDSTRLLCNTITIPGNALEFYRGKHRSG